MRISDWSSDVCSSDLELRHWANVVGSTGAPFDSWLTLRGLRTLFARMQVQQRTAMAIAAWLEQHPAASKVHYPGLPTHPGHAIASRQQSGFGAMLSFELAGGVEEVRRFIANVRYFRSEERRVGKACVSKCKSRWS